MVLAQLSRFRRVCLCGAAAAASLEKVSRRCASAKNGSPKQDLLKQQPDPRSHSHTNFNCPNIHHFVSQFISTHSKVTNPESKPTAPKHLPNVNVGAIMVVGDIKEMYSNLPHNAIKQAVQIPVIANGDIVSLKKARWVLAETGAAGVMIGRAARGQLWLPGAIAEALEHNTGDIRAPAPAKQLALQHRHSAALHDFYGDYLGPRIARKHNAWFLESLREQSVLTSDVAKELRCAFNTLVTPQAQLNARRASRGDSSETRGRPRARRADWACTVLWGAARSFRVLPVPFQPFPN